MQFKTRGTCSSQISFEIEDGKLKNVRFSKGCSGNLQGISSLVEGMPAYEVVTRLKGIDCQGRGTSCPDQLACAIESVLKTQQAG
ncbi:TIGR03905 family TSCPD domain-containing protein [Ruminiclostridium josui]|uniref:TIGR03905 family TSCPD domain-containing protein n=1 Tax=Ruminiclostridium josui TaxID=1499 RepID=UPI0004654560|nr:TIGR03905 family TSCPD domain-containing protein [Ruminiclostridium josui]